MSSGCEHRTGEDAKPLVRRLRQDVVLEVAPIVLAVGRAVEVADLRRAVGDVIAVAVGPLQLVIGTAPCDVVAAHDMALVEGLAILGEEDVGQLQFLVEARVDEPAFLVVLAEAGQAAARVVLARFRLPQLRRLGDVTGRKQRQPALGMHGERKILVVQHGVRRRGSSPAPWRSPALASERRAAQAFARDR